MLFNSTFDPDVEAIVGCDDSSMNPVWNAGVLTASEWLKYVRYLILIAHGIQNFNKRAEMDVNIKAEFAVRSGSRRIVHDRNVNLR